MVDTAEEALDLARRAAAGDAEPSGPLPASLPREAGRVLDLPQDRVLADLDAILTSPAASAGLEVLRSTGLLAVVLPEVAALAGFHEDFGGRHKDLWAHTLEVVERTVPDQDLRWAALLHDIGKTGTRAADGSGGVTFHRHEQVGAVWTRGIGARLGMPLDRVERIAYVIRYHARVNAYEPGWTDRAVRRLAREAGPRLPDLLAFSGADFTTRSPRRASRIRRHLDDLSRRLERLAAEDRVRASEALPRGLGAAVARATGLLPGPELGRLLAWVRAEVARGSLPRGAEVDVYVRAAVERAMELQKG